MSRFFVAHSSCSESSDDDYKMTYDGRHCGCYVVDDDSNRFGSARIMFLPQVSIKAHTSIMASTFRTTLTQTFVNPKKDSPLEEITYTFPLYDGVSVVGFDCEIDGRVIQGVVKERREARAEYEKAKSKGQTAGLMSRSLSAADVFTTNLGNIPAGGRINVKISYLGELKHDAEVDGLRYTMPNYIAPRYGTDESFQAATDIVSSGMSISVDAEMASAIKSVDSPSHAVSVNIGTTSANPGAEPTFNKASASLSTDVSTLHADFVLRVVADKIGEPSAVLETHPTIPNQRALMATLVPKFSLPPIKPEFVFVCDRSGSMGGDRIGNLRRSMHTFLKSLPVGCKFNICSFGSRCSFLWEKSRTYDKDSLNEATAHVETFDSDYGGTEMWAPIMEAFKRRYTDLDTEVFLLTDGDIYDSDRLCKMIQDNVASSNHAIRVFTLGIGMHSSSALIEGVARAGQGFSQTVMESEKMEMKAVRMLKAARTPHVKDYTLEVKYEADEDEFVLVEKVRDVLQLDVPAPAPEADETAEKKPEKKISLYDEHLQNNDTHIDDGEDRLDDLPELPTPSYLLAPHEIPPLLPFSRSTIYVLMSGKSTDRTPTSLVLRGTSRHGPLELEIDITQASQNDTMIHQLAAQKAMQDLEEGRGWLTKAKTEPDDKLLSEVYQSKFSDMVEREAVRLGVKFQVGGKWCSFVAVEKSNEKEESRDEDAINMEPSDNKRRKVVKNKVVTDLRCDTRCDERHRSRMPAAPAPSGYSAWSGGFRVPTSTARSFNAAKDGSDDGSSAGYSPTSPTSDRGAARFLACADSEEEKEDEDVDMPSPGFSPTSPIGARRQGASSGGAFDARSANTSVQATPSGPFVPTRKPLESIIYLQQFDGSWSWDEELEHVIGLTDEQKRKLVLPAHAHSLNDDDADDVRATVFVLLYLKLKLKGDEETWEMMVEKAVEWVREKTGCEVGELEELATPTLGEASVEYDV